MITCLCQRNYKLEPYRNPYLTKPVKTLFRDNWDISLNTNKLTHYTPAQFRRGFFIETSRCI